MILNVAPVDSKESGVYSQGRRRRGEGMQLPSFT
jgi:hypothetical protein